MSIKNWPKQERPRERLLKQGATSLSDAELLAIFLRTGVSGQSAVSLSRTLLIQFGTLSGLMNASFSHFCSCHGLGPAKFTQLQAVMEMARRCLFEDIQEATTLTSPAASAEYLQAQLQHCEEEVFAVLYLNNRHQPIHFEKLFFGTIDSASVYPRVVVKKTLQQNAAAVIIAHNHPSGIAEPSQADRNITESIKNALSMVDIRLLDHFIIGAGEVTSFAECGYL
jgi:DNA repair protein RadC